MKNGIDESGPSDDLQTRALQLAVEALSKEWERCGGLHNVKGCLPIQKAHDHLMKKLENRITITPRVRGREPRGRGKM